MKYYYHQATNATFPTLRLGELVESAGRKSTSDCSVFERQPDYVLPRTVRAMSKATPASASRYIPLSDEQNGTATSTSPSQYAKLPSILRDCAVFVERNEFHPVVYQALALLHQYARDNAGSNKAAAPGTSTANSVDGSDVVAAENPEDRSGSPTPTTTSANSGGFVPVKKFSQFSKNIGSAFKGTEKVLDEALSKLHIRNKSAAATDEIQDTGSADWCDEHFIRVSLLLVLCET